MYRHAVDKQTYLSSRQLQLQRPPRLQQRTDLDEEMDKLSNRLMDVSLALDNTLMQRTCHHKEKKMSVEIHRVSVQVLFVLDQMNDRDCSSSNRCIPVE